MPLLTPLSCGHGVTCNALRHVHCRGSLYRQLGDFNRAQEDFHQAIHKCGLSPDHPTFKLAIRQLALTYNDVAVSMFRSVMWLDQHTVLLKHFLTAVGSPYPCSPCRKARFRDAVQLLNHSIDVEKGDKVLYTNRGGGLSQPTADRDLFHLICTLSIHPMQPASIGYRTWSLRLPITRRHWCWPRGIGRCGPS